jgi:hypothetical protein
MKALIPLVLLVVGLSGCGGPAATSSAHPATSAPGVVATAQPSTAPTVAPSTAPTLRTVTTADLDAMARRIFPGDHPAGCGDFAACPVTDRLRARVTELSRPSPGQAGGVVQFCRCQNGAQSMSVTSEVGGPGGVAHVALHYGAGSDVKLDLVFVRQPDSRLLLDDTQCTGRGAGTSLYAPTLAACGA